MDGRGRIAQSRSPRPRWGAPRLNVGIVVPVRVRRFARRYLAPVAGWHVPRGIGIAASMVLVFGSIAYGTVKGDHVTALVGELRNARDAAANAAGFRVAEFAITGRRLLTDQEVLAAAGVTRETALLFLDVAEARTRLTESPWIAEATVRKLYPGRIEIDITERVPFALWQTDGKINIISADGTVLAPLTERRFVALPLVVGRGAEKKARGFLATLDRHPGDPQRSARRHPGGRAPLEPQAQERNGRAAAGAEPRTRRSPRWRGSTASGNCSPATSRRSTSGCPTA